MARLSSQGRFQRSDRRGPVSRSEDASTGAPPLVGGADRGGELGGGGVRKELRMAEGGEGSAGGGRRGGGSRRGGEWGQCPVVRGEAPRMDHFWGGVRLGQPPPPPPKYINPQAVGLLC